MAKSPGRPARQQTANAATSIVEVACLYFSRHGIRGTSYRQIADAAGVTPAMVHYYFPDKAALHLAVLQATFQSLIRKLADTEDLEQWVHCFHSHVMTHPWCPQLMLREVLPAGGELRELFLQHFAPQVFGSVKAMVRQAFRAAKVPRRLDLDRHVVLLLAMLVYPFLGMEVAQTVTGRSFDTRMMQRFRDDALALFRTGISER